VSPHAEVELREVLQPRLAAVFLDVTRQTKPVHRSGKKTIAIFLVADLGVDLFGVTVETDLGFIVIVRRDDICRVVLLSMDEEGCNNGQTDECFRSQRRSESAGCATHGTHSSG
jgi:hypothetical protein